MESCLRKCSCRNALVILLVIEFSSLFLGADTAYIQASLGFIDVPADTFQRRTAARAADIEGISEIAVLGAEPEVVRYHLFDPHSALTLDCIAIERGDHCHFLCTLDVTVDEWVVTDLGHGLYHPSAEIEFVSHFLFLSLILIVGHWCRTIIGNHLLTVGTWSSECRLTEMALYTTHWT